MVLRINMVIRLINISQLILNYRFAFVVAAGAILEGERDYSEHTLATPTLERMHVLRGVVNLCLVCVKVQIAKVFFVKSRKVVYAITGFTIAHNKQN